jgi:glycosyltransferase involved in cell wall biosynthesis
MPVGLLPALGGGLGALAATGQQGRLIDGYLRSYAAAFGRLYYFSYLRESLAEFTDDTALLEQVTVLAPERPVWRGWRARSMVGRHARQFKECRVLRVFQITGVVPALIARRRFGVPYVTTYGFWYGALSRSRGKRLLKGLLERRGLRHAAAVIVTTEELRARAARLNPRVELIPNGVDTGLFTPGRRERPEAAPRRILSVGRLSPEKNLAAVLTAASSLGGGAVVTMVGGGPLRDALEAQARREGVVVEFPGVMDHRRLPAVYRAADVFVLASFTEGHPKVLLEAMACGLPVVASDCPGNRSLVEEGRTGLLFDPRRPEELAACLKRILDDEALARRLGDAGRALVEARYDLRRLVEGEIQLLRGVMGRT